MSFYNDYNRGGYLLNRFLSGYSSYMLSLDNKEIKKQDINVLNELKCKANELIKLMPETKKLLQPQFIYCDLTITKSISQVFNEIFQKFGYYQFINIFMLKNLN